MRVLPSLLTCLLNLIRLDAVLSFSPPPRATPPLQPSATALHGFKKGGKFSKQKDLAAKMEAAKRQRERAEGGGVDATPSSPSDETLSNEEIKLRNDRRRFENLLENSMYRMDGDGLGMDYLTVEQEEENADAVYRGIARLYEGDPAPSTPFAELRSIQTGEPIGKSGVSRLLPWENNAESDDYIVVITDPRPKSVELRSAIKKLCGGAVAQDIVNRIVVINSDGPGENRKFLKNSAEGSMAEKLTVLIDEDLEWMREYTALGEKRFSMTMFVLSGGKCEKIAREVDADLICNAVTNAVRAMKSN